jgi:Raf kinase inhibitor-like YbhB/YbcL family protein
VEGHKQSDEEVEMTLRISSPAFEDGGLIPVRYTCNGEDVSPSIEIAGVPEGTKSLVLIFDDPDAAREPHGTGRTWDHWILFNIPPDTTNIPEGSIPPGALEGPNDFGNLGYGGPCPPTFRHKYDLKLYAIDTVLDLKKGASKRQVESAMPGHILDSATYTGFYEQPARRR